MKPSATSGAADVTQVISPQCCSAHAHSPDGNPALRCVPDAVGAPQPGGFKTSTFYKVPLILDQFGLNVYFASQRSFP